MMTYFYPAIFEHHDKDDMFTAVFPDLPGCQAQGRSMDETAKRQGMPWPLLFWKWKKRKFPFPCLPMNDFSSAV